MATTKKQVIQVRSNVNMNVNYENLLLTPQVELIVLTQEPLYKIQKDSIVKASALGEFRCFISLDGLNDMISELQSVAIHLQTFHQMSGSLNKVIEQYRKPTEENKTP
jgi:hypothetical protein